MNKPKAALQKFLPPRFRARVVGVSWRDLMLSLIPIALVTGLAIWALLRFNHPSAPDTIIISSGPPGSSFELNAQRYAKILARNRVKLTILPSQGSLENLKRLNDPKFKVDIGFVQGGVASPSDTDNLVSLGSLFYVPLMVFYRNKTPLDRISDFTGKRIAVGPDGSGTRALTMNLLKGNGIVPGGATQLTDAAGEEAADALLAGDLDAAFLMGDSATPAIMRKLLLDSRGVRLLNFAQADAYTRRYPYLNKLSLPMGSFDVGKNLPADDLALIAPTVEMVARQNLAPALSDLLIEAAREVHGRAGLLQRAGEFPSPLEHEFRISDDATRFYQSGKGFFYRNFPFWLANILNRLVLFIVPLVVVLVPGLRMVPALYSWRIRSRIYRWYGVLIGLERAAMGDATPEEREEMRAKLDEIETAVNQMKVPLAYADQFYILRIHIGFVRDRLAQALQRDDQGKGDTPAEPPSPAAAAAAASPAPA